MPVKTNAMRILDKVGIAYNCFTYDHNDGLIDGISVAAKIGQPEEKVYKTLVAQGASGEYYVFIIPVAAELDLKAAASAAGEKSVAMIKVSDLTRVTGYVRGGCSPIGMKKQYPTIIDESCQQNGTIIISAGKIGLQIELAPEDLARLVNGRVSGVAINRM